MGEKAAMNAMKVEDIVKLGDDGNEPVQAISVKESSEKVAQHPSGWFTDGK